MSSYLASNKIDVFPSTHRAGYETTARLITEANLINLINQLLDRESFIITNEENFSTATDLEFNIHGYYFKANKAALLALDAFPSANDIIEASITLSSSGDYTTLSGSDESSEYKGLAFNIVSQATDDTSTTFYLPIVKYENNSWKLLTSNYKLIDGGKF